MPSTISPVIQTFIEDAEYAYIKFARPHLQPNTSTNRAVFMLHGFPGNLSRRNEDLGQKIARDLGITVFLLHYRGLGKHKGQFSFSSTIDQAKAALHSVKSDFQSWILIGHSWGGLVAAAIANTIPTPQIEKILLLSPFNTIPENKDLRDILHGMQLDSPELIGHLTLDELVADLEFIKRTNDPRSNLLRIRLPKEKIHIIQALNDEVVSPQSTESLKKLLNEQVSYETIADDHSFLTNRSQFLNRVLEILC